MISNNVTDVTYVSENIDAISKTLLATAAVSFIISILGSFGNLLTILALFKSTKIFSTSKLYVIALALIEMTYCIVVLPINGAHYSYLFHTRGMYFFSQKGCAVFNVIRFTLSQSELQIILAIGLTRAIAITFPTIHQVISNPLVVCFHVVLIFLYSFLIRLPVAIGTFGQYTYNHRSMKCGLGEDVDSRVYRGYAMTIETIIPISLIILSYIYIFIKLKIATYQARRPSNDLGLSRTGSGASGDNDESITDIRRNLERKRKDMELTTSIFIIFVILTFCTVPITVVHILQTVSQGRIRYPKLFLTFHITYWMHFCLNIFVYVLCNRQYRGAYIDLLRKMFPNSARKFSICSVPPPRKLSSDVLFKSSTNHEDEEVCNDHVILTDAKNLYFEKHDLSVIPEVRTSDMPSSDISSSVVVS